MGLKAEWDGMAKERGREGYSSKILRCHKAGIVPVTDLGAFSPPESTRTITDMSHDAEPAWPGCHRVVLSRGLHHLPQFPCSEEDVKPLVLGSHE